MSEDSPSTAIEILQHKRDATSYQILVAIADEQPAISQQEIADRIGITAQAVSEYLQELIAEDYVRTSGRGRYEITKEGVDWLISRTESLDRFLEYVTEEVIEGVGVDAAIATADIESGDGVVLSMRDGLLHATPGAGDGANARAVSSANAGEDVAVSDFEGILDFDPGTVTILPVADIERGGSRSITSRAIRDRLDERDLLAAGGVEAVVACQKANTTPSIRFGSIEAVPAAATRGLDVLLVVTDREVSRHVEALRDHGIQFEVVDRDGE